MKKIAFFFIFFAFLASAGWGQNYKWTGAANDGDWINPANWETGGPFTETIDGQLVTLTYSTPPAGTIWALTGGGGGNNYFVINDVNGNAVPYPTGSLGVDNLVIQSGSLKLDVDGQFDILIIEGGTFIRNGGFLQAATIKMTSGILDLNGMGNIDIPSSGWDITGGIIIRDDVNNYSQAPPTINNDNVIDIGGPSSGGGGGGKDNFIWTGGADTDWDNAANWVSGNVPVLGNTIKIIINSSTSPDTNIPSTITCNSFVIAAGANFNLNDNLEIYSLLDNKETFNCGSGTVTLIGTITVKGDNTFYDLDCTNALVKFESGKTQTITNELTASGADLRAINNSLPRWNLNVNPANVTIMPASIGECNSANFLNWLGLVTDSGHNINVFTGANIFEWEGTTDTDWTTGSNWLGGTSPGDGDPAYTIIIQSPSTHYPIFSGTDLTCSNLIIETGASLNMDVYDLTVLDELENNGNLILAGAGSQAVDLTAAVISANETVTYDSNGGHFAGLINFKNLTIQSGARTGVVAITVSGNFRLEGGSLNAASINVTGTSYIAENITANGNQTYTGKITLGNDVTLTATTGSVILNEIDGDSNSLTINGNAEFNDVANNLATLLVTGTSTIGADITTLGNQTYTGAITTSGSDPLILKSGGNIQTGGAVSGAVGITIEADNDIIIGAGGINVPGAVVTLEAGGDITVSGKITGYQLIAKAPNGDVTVDGVEIDLSNTGSEGSSAAIYVVADVFNVTSTSGSIIPGGTGGQLCLVLNTQWTSAGVVDGNEDVTGSTPIRWHQHVTIKSDLVYYDHNILPGTINTLFPSAVPVADDDLKTVFTVNTNKNIYIYNVDSSLALTFTTSGTGAIEFIGTNNFTGMLTLNTGSGGVRLADTDITLTGNFGIGNNEKLTVATDSILNTGASSIKAANITLDDVFAVNNEDLALEAASISINGTVGTSASHLGGVSITSGNITFDDIVYAKSLFVNDNTIINADITTIADQTYTGKVTLGDDVTLTATTGSVILNEIDGDSNSLTINGDAEFNDDADNLATLLVTGTSTISADITTLGNQTYTGKITLDNDVELAATTGSVILNEIDGDSNSLTINGDAEFNDDADNLTTLHVTGTSTIGADITTLGNQTYTGNVTLGGAGVIRTLQGTTVTLGAITGVGNSLTIDGDGVLNGGSDIVNLSVIGNSVINQNITTTANQTYDANVTITGTITLSSNGGSFTANGIVSGTDVTVRASQGISLTGANTLNGSITLENSSNGDITFTNTSASVTLAAENNSGGGEIIIDQTGSLVIASLKTVTTGSISIDTTGAVTQTGVIETDSLKVEAVTGITLASVNKVITSVDLTNNGTGDIEFKNDCTSAGVLTVKAAANRDVTVTETAGGLKIDEITAAGDISLNVEKDVDSTLPGKLTGHNITVNAGGNITLLDITTVSGGTVSLNAGFPDHMVYGTPGTVTLTDIDIAGDLVIWCESVDGITGTKDVYGNVDLNTDDTGDAGTFLGYFNTIGSQENKERPHNFELGPLPQTYPAFTHIPLSPWLSPITITGTSNIYITGSITAAGDLTIKTESGDIVFEGAYDSNGFDINLETTSGKIILGSGSQIIAEALNIIAGSEIIQNSGSIITAVTLSIDSGGAVELAQNNEVQNLTIVSAGGDVEFKNVGNIIISGISAGVNTVDITVTGDIDLSGNINASSIEIEAGTVTGSGTVAASTGDISFIGNAAGVDSNLSLARFNAAGTIFVSTKTADIVYYSSVPSAMPPSGLWTTPLFVEANSVYNRNVELKTLNTSNNIYLVDVVDTSSKKLTVDSSAGTGTNGFIEFFSTSTEAYKYSGSNINHLELLAGAGGVRIVNAVVDITGNFTINDALTLDGSNASGIKAENITLDRVTAKNNNENLTLEAGGNITVSGKVTVYQLIAIAPSGAVTIDEIEIDPSNTGNESLSAAIYIAADEFFVTTATAGSIKPGGRPAGLQWGQLCLVLNTPWEDIDSVVDGPEDDDPPGTISGARWHQHPQNPVYITGRILYSFTEDSTGNGRLDRIRVQTNVMLNGNFSGFDAEIINNEYDIDRTKGANGFQLVSDFTGAVSFDDDSFYIYLTEKPGIDGGNTPLWSVIKNESLMDKAASPSLVGNPAADKNIKPIDTIPPRIAYSLTLPDHPQTYLRMTEPVASSSGVDVSASFGGAPVTAQTAEPANLGYLFDLPDSFEIDDLAHLNIGSLILTKGYFQINDIVDQGQWAEDLSAADPDAQPPKYPLNWGYTSYAKVYDDGTAKDAAGGSVLLNNVFVPPNKLLTAGMMTKLAGGNGDQVTPNNDPVIRRVTDVLVSIAPADGIDNYFAWPVWASPSGVGAGNIFNFDGTAYLERALVENGIELQARINSALTGNLELFWTTADIPAEFRNPEETAGVKRVGGLWLPDIFNNPLYYYVSMFPMSGGINLNNTPANNPPLFTYNIAADDLADGSSIKLEFIFRLSNISDMFAARLDVPNAAAIPHNWYALVRPFAFDIQNIRRQRGGVTILNNVINSNNREVTYLRYHLVRPGRVTIQVYTLDGTLVKSLKRNEYRDAGEWTEEWNGTNNGGRPVARGMYFIRVVGPDIDEIRKVMVVK